jgi:hypothetical protein
MGAAEFATRESQPSVTPCEWIVGRKFAAARPSQIVELCHGTGEPGDVEEAL